MSIIALNAKVARLEQELKETRDEIARATEDPAALAEELSRTRAYAFSAQADPLEASIQGCVDSIRRYGFCVIDNVIPTDQVDAIREEIVAAQAKSSKNIEAIKDLAEEKDLRDEALLEEATARGLELRRVRKAGHPPKPPNDIIWMPKYAPHLSHPAVTGAARRVLDEHVRIAQLHPRPIAAESPDGTPGGFGAVKYRGRANTREWHTDWPHDLSAYGRDNPYQNAGCVRQPFPDVTLCLVMIWYLTDVDPTSGGTWVVPGSHRDARNPRGPKDNMVVTAPIPGDIQVSAKAGSVYIQDSRSWHSSAMHNTSGRARVAVVNRWCPWWISVDDFAPGDEYSANIVCRPLTRAEYLDLPEDVRPLFRHVCPDERDVLQQPVLDRAAAAGDRTALGFNRLERDPDGLAGANDHVRVVVERKA